jgi:hypothetical protein
MIVHQARKGIIMSAIDEMLERINVHNLERIRVSCEADGDQELAELIRAKLASGTSSASDDIGTARS